MSNEKEKFCKDCEKAELSAGFYYCNFMKEYTTFAKTNDKPKKCPLQKKIED